VSQWWRRGSKAGDQRTLLCVQSQRSQRSQAMVGRVTWSVEDADSGRPFIDFRCSGVLGDREIAEAFDVVVNQARQRNLWHILADLRELKGGQTVFDLYGFVKTLASVNATGAFREAVVRPIDVEGADLVEFWETAARNRGLNVQTFNDRQSAIDWLSK